MLIACPECKNQISDKAYSCPRCGLPLSSIPLSQTKPKKAYSRTSTKPLRLKNGYGQIHKLAGRRRCPYAAYPPTQDYASDGKPIRRKALGYFATYQEALDCLSEYNKAPYDENLSGITFEEVYRRFCADKFEGKKEYSASMQRGMLMAFRHSEALHKKEYRLIKPADYQSIIDNSELRHSTLEFLVQLYKQMGKFAMRSDIVTKDNAQFCRINIKDDDEHGIPFSEAEMRLLWSHRDYPTVQKILVLCYSGFRVSAYSTIKIENDCFIGGVKTGKNRTVPIHPSVSPWAKDVVGLDAQQFRKDMRRVLKEIGCEDHTPHDCRHTMSWLLTTSGCDDFTRHLILGHSIQGDVEAKVYTHRTLDELRAAIEKCPIYVG